MAFEIEIISGLTRTGLGTQSMEVAASVVLTSKLNGSRVKAEWSQSSNGDVICNASFVPEVGTVGFSGTGFGKATITAQFEGAEARLDICVGSVVIAGADGSYWQVFSDGSVKLMDQRTLREDITTLVKNNAIIADLTDNSTPFAVTCYLLNLKSFTPKIK
jgi:hypothetical protein